MKSQRRKVQVEENECEGSLFSHFCSRATLIVLIMSPSIVTSPWNREKLENVFEWMLLSTYEGIQLKERFLSLNNIFAKNLVGIFRRAEMLITAFQIKEHATLRARTNSVFFPFVTCCKQGPRNIYLSVFNVTKLEFKGVVRAPEASIS